MPDSNKALPTISYKTNWDLSQLYSSVKELDKHVKKIERAYTAFEKKYKGKSEWLTSQGRLLSALEEYEDLIKLKAGRPCTYLSMARDLNSEDKEIEAKLNQVSEKMTHIGNKLLFFSLALGSLPPSKQKQYLKGKTLKPYRYYLKQVFETSKYQLTEKEEQIINLWSIPAYDFWVKGVTKEINKLTVSFKKKDIPLSEAFNRVSELPTLERRNLWNKCMKALDGVLAFATHELNAVVTEKKIEDNLRGFKKPYSSTVIGYENDMKTVENLVATVTDNFKVSHGFYRLKKDILGLKNLEYADRSANIGSITTSFTFDEQVALFREALQEMGDEYRSIFDDLLEEGRVDVKPKKGKKGGAYCICGSSSVPVFVLLNDVETFNSFRTLSHELGHAIHGELTKRNARPIYQSFSTSTAEVASTLFENLAFDRVLQELNEKEQVIALHDKLNASISTIFRQIAFFNFENELHTIIREKGVMSQEEIKETLNKHMKAYLGSAVDMKEQDGNFFISTPHFRYFFYVYAYAYGELISNVLYDKYKEDHTYEESIREFLSSGAARAPKDIFKSIGLSVDKPAFFEKGVEKIGKEIKQLRRLAKKADML